MTYIRHLRKHFTHTPIVPLSRGTATHGVAGSSPRSALHASTLCLLLALFLIPSTTSAQYTIPKRDIQPVDSTNKTNTTTPTVLKKWYALISNKDGHYLHTYLPAFLVDSIHVDTGGVSGGGDFAFWLPDSATPVPSPADSAVRTGYTLFDGLSGGLPTKIEMLENGIVNFNRSGIYNTPAYVMSIDAIQPGVNTGKSGFITYASDNAYGSKKNQVFAFGINPLDFDDSATGLYYSIEDHYRPGVGNAYSEIHLVFNDSLDIDHRIDTWILDKLDPDLFSTARYVKKMELRDPHALTSDSTYFRIEQLDGNQTQMLLLGSNGSTSGNTDGIAQIVNRSDNNFQVYPFGSMPSSAEMYVNGFNVLNVNKLRIINDFGTTNGSNGNPVYLYGGENSYGGVVRVPFTEAVDSLMDNGLRDSIIANIPADPTWYEVGGTSPPNSNTDDIYKSSGKVGIGESSPANRLEVVAASASDDESILRLSGGSAGFGGGNEADQEHSILFDLCGFDGASISQISAAMIGVKKEGSWNEADNGVPGIKSSITFKTQSGTMASPSLTERMRITSAGRVGIATTSPSQTLHVQGTARITGSSGAAASIVGRDGDGDINTITPGPGLSLLDNVLSIIPTSSDSTYLVGDSLCIIDSGGDTTCFAQDSFYIQGDTSLCVITLGDTLCSPYSSSGGNIYTIDGSLTANRTLFFNTHSLKLSHGSPYGQILFNQTGLYPMMRIDGQALSDDTSPLFEINSSNQSDAYMRFNGLAAEDYSMGQDKSTDALVISGGETLTADPLIYLSHTQDSIIMYKDVQLDAGLLDGGGDIGGSGQVLTSTGTETNWVSPVSLNVPISGLIAALGSNTINNANYTQEWQWNSLGAASGLKLSSTSTAAASNSQKVFEIALSGANATSAQSTFGIYASNTHTGTTSTNYGVAGVASGGATWNAGVAGSSSGTNGYGVTGTSSSTTGSGVRGATTATSGGYGVYAYSSDVDSPPLMVESEASGTTGVISLATLQRRGSSNPAPGFGSSITWTNTIRNMVPTTTNTITSTWADTTYATRDSRLTMTGINDGSATDILYLEGDKRTRFNGRAEYTQGADVASVAGAISLGYDGNVFEITGTNAITLISNVGWQNGSVVTLVFSSTASLVHGTATSGTDITLKLGGSANFSATADDTITLMLCEQGGTQAWREISRSAN